MSLDTHQFYNLNFDLKKIEMSYTFSVENFLVIKTLYRINKFGLLNYEIFKY